MSSATPSPGTPAPQGSWYRSAADDERLRLFTGPSVAAFCVSMALALWLALPGASLVERLSQSSRSDLLTVAYLRAWLAAEPEDLPLQLALARKHLGLGDWDAAIAALAEPSVARSPDMRRDAQWLKMEVLERRLASATPGTPE
ncbi:MAG: hypothetical protein O9972_14405, partial [Burkholderiales bacterium]|nr:hypothetical protein [Burkholderiales bacterium]